MMQTVSVAIPGNLPHALGFHFSKFCVPAMIVRVYLHVVSTLNLCCRSDAVPRLSYASVEGIFVELVGASPVRRAANDVKHR